MQFFAIFVLLQCLYQCQGRFNIERFSENLGKLTFERSFDKHSNIVSMYESDTGVAEFPKELIRIRRQNMGGNPQAFSFNITEGLLEYGVIIYLGEGSKVIYFLTLDVLLDSYPFYVTGSILYRSTDDGRTFQSQSNKLPQGSILHYTVYRIPNSNDVMFADAFESMIYVTTNEGETFNSYIIPADPRTLKVHPTLSRWILGYDFVQGAIMYSEDLGASWATVAENIHPPGVSGLTDSFYYYFNWGEPDIDWDINNPRQSDMTKVFYTVYDVDRHSISTLYNTRILYIAKNPGSGYVSEVFDPNLGYFSYFRMDSGYIFAYRYASTDFQRKLYVSYMRQPFDLVRVPAALSQYRQFSITHRPSQILLVVHNGSHFNLYTSDTTGIYYTLSLENIAVLSVPDVGLIADVESINGVNGTIMANQFTFVDGEQLNQTVISTDNGASWQKIAPPDNIEGVPSNCRLPSCSLHFHLHSSRDKGIDSYSSAPGIIIAHGNLGSYLTGSVSTYISRDGGITWEQTLNGLWYVEIADHGGLLVAAAESQQNYTMTIKYSCNEGMSWSDFNFSNNSITLWGMSTEPGETTTQVLVFGHPHDSRSSWIITHINFTSIFHHSCEESDYYYWTVSDGRNGDQQCLLGEHRIIERRKPSVCCWNGRNYERTILASSCECTTADFECEWGYYRDEISNNCTLNQEYGPQADCLTGYRKIPGDKCYEGVSTRLLPPSDCSDVPISSNSGRNSDSGAIIGGAIGGVVLMITVVSCIVIFMRRAQRKKDDSPNVINPLTVGIVNMEQENLDIPIHPPVPEHVYGVINQPQS